MKYVATMEFVGHHYIEFEAGSHEEAYQIMEDSVFNECLESTSDCSYSEECIPTALQFQYEGDSFPQGEFIWQI